MSWLLGLTVFQAESLALERNFSLKAQEHSALSSRWSAWGSWASLGPQLSLSASYSDAGALGPWGGGKLYNFRLSVSQPLFSASRFTSAMSSGASWRAQRSSLQHQRLAVRLSAAQAFVSALKAKGRAEVQKRSLERARRALELVQARLEIGEASEADLAKARADLLSAELALLKAEAEERKALLVLRETLGGVEAGELEEPPPPDTSLPPLDSLVRRALERREDLRQLEHSAWASHWGFWGAFLTFSPEVSVSYSWNYWGQELPSSLEDFERSSGLSWSLAFPITSWPFNFMAQSETHKAAAAQVEAKRLSVAREVAEAYEDFRAALEALRVARKSLDAARKAYELVKAQYELGQAGVLELSDAERALAEAEVQLRDAKLDLFMARRSLEIIVGEGK